MEATPLVVGIVAEYAKMYGNKTEFEETSCREMQGKITCAVPSVSTFKEFSLDEGMLDLTRKLSRNSAI